MPRSKWMGSTTYDGWRKRWPAVIVQQQDETAAELLEDYYESNDGVPAFSGSSVRTDGRAHTDRNCCCRGKRRSL